MRKMRFEVGDLVTLTACATSYDNKAAKIEVVFPLADIEKWDVQYVISIGREKFAARDFQLRKIIPTGEPQVMISRQFYELHKA